MITSLKFTNSSDKTIKLILEPWAEEYEVLAGMTVEIVTSEPKEKEIEVEYEGADIIIYGWSDNMSVLSQGEELSPSFG